MNITLPTSKISNWWLILRFLKSPNELDQGY